MGPLDLTINYFILNWVSILFAIFLASFFYYFSIRGIKKLITSRQEERLKIAKESIVDVLEHQIINNSDINTDKIIHLLNATSRDRGVSLSNEYTSLNLLEDLELRFAKSKHLKNEQRDEYIEKIEILLKKIEDEKSTIIPSYEKVLNDLEESIDIKNTESISQNLNFLKTKLILEKEKRNEPEVALKLMAAGITAFMFAIVSFVSSYETLGSSIFEKILLMTMIIALVLSIIIVVILRRGYPLNSR